MAELEPKEMLGNRLVRGLGLERLAIAYGDALRPLPPELDLARTWLLNVHAGVLGVGAVRTGDSSSFSTGSIAPCHRFVIWYIPTPWLLVPDRGASRA